MVSRLLIFDKAVEEKKRTLLRLTHIYSQFTHLYINKIMKLKAANHRKLKERSRMGKMVLEEAEEYSGSEGLMNWKSSRGWSWTKEKMINKRRFSDDQVNSLESIFENETKLDPKKKLLVANQLGLQPRQVSIWFQNKRARFKSKQLESELHILRLNFNALSSHFDILNKEKHSLLLQLQKLKDEVGKGEGENHCGNDSSEETRSEIDKVESNDTNKSYESKLKTSLSLQGSEYGASMLSDEGSSENTHYFRMEEETDILAMVQPLVDSSLSSAQGWDDLHPDGLFDQPVDSSQWLDFWS